MYVLISIIDLLISNDDCKVIIIIFKKNKLKHNKMIKEAYAQCNVDYLLKLFESYYELKDEQEIFYIGGRLIQSNEQGLNKETYIRIFDVFYQIFAKNRSSLRQLVQLEQYEDLNGKLKNKHFIEEYKIKLCSDFSQTLTKLINDIKKGIRNSENKNVSKLNLIINEHYRKK